MIISDFTQYLAHWAPLSLQEPYDNCGLLTGNTQTACTGVLCALDATEAIVDEAVAKGCNLIVVHHPLIFHPLKKIDQNHPVGRTLIRAIQQDIAVYAMHTNLDNVINGVNGAAADRLALSDREVLLPKPGQLKKLYTFVPASHMDVVADALFQAGAGHVGRYDQCSFRQAGEGSFRASPGTNPFVGKIGERHLESEWKLEVLYPAHLEKTLVQALQGAHPYEEVAYDLVVLSNPHPSAGSGLIGLLPEPMNTRDFLGHVKSAFNCSVLRYSEPRHSTIHRVAICGGAGSFLISNALAQKADAFLTADLKYHDFFEPDGKMLLVDLGHYESEQFTIGLIQSFLAEKFPNFAVLKTDQITNPVRYH